MNTGPERIPDQFGIVTGCRVGHAVARNTEGDPLEGVVIHATGVSSQDGGLVEAVLFLLPGMAQQLAENLTEKVSTLGHQEDPG
jgi:hypothetical protein